MPDEEWFPIPLRLVHEAVAALDEDLVDSLHVVFRLATRLPSLTVDHVTEWRQGAFVDDPLLSNLAPAWHLGGIIHVRCPRVDYVAWAELVDLVLRVVERVGIGHRI